MSRLNAVYGADAPEKLEVALDLIMQALGVSIHRPQPRLAEFISGALGFSVVNTSQAKRAVISAMGPITAKMTIIAQPVDGEDPRRAYYKLVDPWAVYELMGFVIYPCRELVSFIEQHRNELPDYDVETMKRAYWDAEPEIGTLCELELLQLRRQLGISRREWRKDR